MHQNASVAFITENCDIKIKVLQFSDLDKTLFCVPKSTGFNTAFFLATQRLTQSVKERRNDDVILFGDSTKETE